MELTGTLKERITAMVEFAKAHRAYEYDHDKFVKRYRNAGVPYTEAAEKFCRETGVDALAVSIGNAHGEYKETPHLDLQRLEEINAATKTPLVLHGGSGIPDDQLLAAFSKGINKFNLGTDFLKRYFRAVTEYTRAYADSKDPVRIIEMPEYVQSRLQPYLEERLTTLCHF